MAKKAAPPQETPETETPVAETPEVQQPEATVSTPESTPEPTPEPNPLLEKFTAAGFEGVTDEKTAAERALEAWTRDKAELDRIRQEYEQAKPYVDYGKRYLETQAAPKVEVAETEPTPNSWWSPPPVDMRLVRHYQETKLDPATNEPITTWKPNAPAELKEAVEQHELYQTQWAQKLVENPVEALKPFREEILAEANRLIEEKYGAKYQEQTTEQFVSSFERDNADWLFAKDPLTQRPLPNLTPEAEKWFGAAQRYGITDPQLVCQYVLECREREQFRTTSQQASTQVQAAQVADQKRREIVARNAAGAPNRNGSQLPPENGVSQQNRNLSLKQKLRQAIHEDGVEIPT